MRNLSINFSRDLTTKVATTMFCSLLILVLIAMASLVFADSSSSTLGFITKGQEIMKIMTGPFAKILCVIAVVGAAIAYAFQGEDYKNLVKALMYLCMVIAIALGAVNLVEFLGGTDLIPLELNEDQIEELKTLF